jgi:signal transduction histidine kinase
MKLKVILKNLISNAVKFTEQGSVTVDVHPRGTGVELSVADTGIGVGAEVLPIIFEPFRQGERAMTRRFGGVGLGLYIVHRLLDMLGGTITVESTIGHGSTFRVWVPLTVTPSRVAA